MPVMRGIRKLGAILIDECFSILFQKLPVKLFLSFQEGQSISVKQTQTGAKDIF